jgi:exosortase B
MESQLALGRPRNDPILVSGAIVALGLLAMFLPVFYDLARTVWATDEQGHGPIILCVSAWLCWHRRAQLRAAAERATPATGLGAWALLAGSLLLFVLGRVENLLTFQMAALIPLLTAAAALTYGWEVAKAAAFPIFFLIFAIPLPGAVVDMLTQPLKRGVSYVAEQILYQFGYPIARSGVVLVVGQYQLLVADACAGLNSLFTLESLGLLYLNIVGHTSRWRNLMLALLILPISFSANVVRVCILVLVTYYFGDEAGQGFVHGFAGMVLFLVGLMLMLATDKLLGRLIFKD